MLDTFRPGPPTWTPEPPGTDMLRGFAAPLSATAENQPNAQSETTPQSQEKTITLAELDIHALTEQVLALLHDPNREEFKFGSPKTDPILSIKDGPFVIAELIVRPAGSSDPHTRLLLHILPPILANSDEPSKYMDDLIGRARRSELGLQGDQHKRYAPLYDHYKFDRLTWDKQVEKTVKSYVEGRSREWIYLIRSQNLSSEVLASERERLWKVVFSYGAESMIDADTRQIISQTGFVPEYTFSSIKRIADEVWKQCLSKYPDLKDNYNLWNFPSEQLLTEQMSGSDRNKADFPDKVGILATLFTDYPETNIVTIKYLLAELKAAVGLWHAHPGLRDDPLTAGGMLFPTESKPAPQPVELQQLSPLVDAVKRPIGFAFLGPRNGGAQQPTSHPSSLAQNRPIGFSTPRR